MKAPQDKRDPADDVAERERLAQRLRETREYLGFSQEEVAQHLGISRSAMSNMENGQRKVEAVELKRLAEMYKRPLSYFTGEPEAPGQSLPADVEHLARKATKLTPKDRQELERFADFLRSRAKGESGTSARD
jgi:transcriptional regulator with XRE-family HTH domain